MFKSVLAITVAAACAAVFVGFVPPPAPAVAAVQTPEPGAPGTAKHETGVSGINIRGSACVQAWPYYEATCLNDSQQASGKSRVIRVIALDRATTKPIPR